MEYERVQTSDNTSTDLRVLLLDLGQELRGGQRQVFYLIRALEAMRQRGAPVEAVVACLGSGPLAALLREHDLPFVALPGRSIVNPALLLSLRRAIRSRSINILHTQDAKAATVGSWFKDWNPHLKLIHSRRVSYPLRPGGRSKKYLTADALIGVSQAISQGMIDSGMPAGKVFTIHSGVDPERYTPKIQRGDRRFVFGAVGALTEQKGFGVLVQAMSVLAEMDDILPWEVRIVGEGPLFGALLKQAQTLGIAERLSLFGKQEASLFLPQFDALLVPSVDGEGSNAVIKEGWAVGVPVVCSALPSNEELVCDKENGLVVPKGNPLALSAAMLRLLSEPALRERLTTSGRRTLQFFTDKHMAARTYLVYQATSRGFSEAYARQFNNELTLLTLPEHMADAPSDIPATNGAPLAVISVSGNATVDDVELPLFRNATRDAASESATVPHESSTPPDGEARPECAAEATSQDLTAGPLHR